jgi:hypothetical protein
VLSVRFFYRVVEGGLSGPPLPLRCGEHQKRHTIDFHVIYKQSFTVLGNIIHLRPWGASILIGMYNTLNNVLALTRKVSRRYFYDFRIA